MHESKQMTDQQLYDKVKAHLLAQGRKSENDDGTLCLYRGPEGTKCAAGALIDDAHYSPAFNECAADDGQVQAALLASGVREDQMRLVEALQALHDGCAVADWPSALTALAKRHGLQP